MYKYEKKLEEKKREGVRISDGLDVYLRCARLGGIDALERLGDKHLGQMTESEDKETVSYLMEKIYIIAELVDYLDDCLCTAIDRVEKAGLYST